MSYVRMPRAIVSTPKPLAALCLIPVAAAIVNHDWLSNRIGDPDTYFYLGYFRNLSRFIGQGNPLRSSIFETYFQARFPYIFPGWLIYQVFSPALAKIVFAGLIFLTSVTSIYRAFSSKFGTDVTVLAIGLLSCDIFFIRSIGWTYVDNGIMAYTCLSLALMTMASEKPERRFAYIGAAGFCASSTLFIHLGSAVVMLFSIIYGLCVLKLGTRLTDYIAALVGLVCAQCLWGSMNVLVWHGHFFSLLDQVAVGRHEMLQQDQFHVLTFDLLLRDGYWNCMQIALWAAAAGVLGLCTVRRNILPRNHIVVLAATFATISCLIVGHFVAHSIFFVRDGLYSSFFLPMTYLSVAVIIGKGRPLKGRMIAGIIGLFLFSLLLRLRLHGDASSLVGSVPAWLAMVVVASSLVVLFVVQSDLISYAICVVLAGATLFMPWRFDHDTAIDRAYDIISNLTGPRLPRIGIDPRDGKYPKDFISIIASFAPTGWYIEEFDFPSVQESSLGQPIFILTRHARTPDELRAYLLEKYTGVVVNDFISLVDKEGPFWIYEATLDAQIETPGVTISVAEIRDGIPAAKLPGIVGEIDGASRRAEAGRDPAGVLTFGPYARIKEGHYVARIRYRASTDQHFDMVDGPHAETTLASGALPQTGEQSVTLAVPFNISAAQSRLEVRTFFSGTGSITVDDISLRPALE